MALLYRLSGGIAQAKRITNHKRNRQNLYFVYNTPRQAFYLENLGLLRTFTAVFVVSDVYAAELLRFLTGQGIAVPGDINLAGFDDTPLCTLLSPTLTTVRQDIPLRAKIAVEKLRLLKQGRETEVLVRLPVRLIARESTR